MTPRDAARERFRRIRAATLVGSAAAFAVLVGAAAATGVGGDDGSGSQGDAGAVSERAQEGVPAADDGGGDFWDAVRSEAQGALGDAVDGGGGYFGEGDGGSAPSSRSGAS